jgi:hypothetical protein
MPLLLEVLEALMSLAADGEDSEGRPPSRPAIEGFFEEALNRRAAKKSSTIFIRRKSDQHRTSLVAAERRNLFSEQASHFFNHPFKGVKLFPRARAAHALCADTRNDCVTLTRAQAARLMQFTQRRILVCYILGSLWHCMELTCRPRVSSMSVGVLS